MTNTYQPRDEYGVRTQKHTENFERIFKDWHRTTSARNYALDVDLIEFRLRAGKVVPVALFELCSTQKSTLTVEERGEKRRDWQSRPMQAEAMRGIAATLGIPLYFLIYTTDLSHFYLYEVETMQWTTCDQPEMILFLNSL